MNSYHYTTTAQITTATQENMYADITIDYTAKKPFEVSLTILTAPQPVVWIFDRELFKQGIYTKTGLGDVVIEPQGTVTLIHLSSPSGKATIRISTVHILAAVINIYNIVPSQEEYLHIDIDAEVKQLLEKM